MTDEHMYSSDYFNWTRFGPQVADEKSLNHAGVVVCLVDPGSSIKMAEWIPYPHTFCVDLFKKTYFFKDFDLYYGDNKIIYKITYHSY